MALSTASAPAGDHPLRRALDTLYLWAGYLAGFFLLAIFALMMGLSVGRQIGVNIPAGDDFAAWCMAAMAFLGLAHTFRNGEMIRVGLILERLGGRAKHVMELAALAVATAFTGYFTWYATVMTYQSWQFNDMSQGTVVVPLWFPQLGFCTGLIILLIALVDELIHVARGNPPSFEKPPPETPDEFVARVAEGGGI